MRLPTGLRGIAVPQLQSLLEQSLSSKGHLHRFAGHCRIPMRLPDGIPRFVSPIWLQNKFEIQFFFFFKDVIAMKPSITACWSKNNGQCSSKDGTYLQCHCTGGYRGKKLRYIASTKTKSHKKVFAFLTFILNLLIAFLFLSGVSVIARDIQRPRYPAI